MAIIRNLYGTTFTANDFKMLMTYNGSKLIFMNEVFTFPKIGGSKQARKLFIFYIRKFCRRSSTCMGDKMLKSSYFQFT